MSKKIILGLLLILLFAGFASALTIEEINAQSGTKTPVVFFKTPTCHFCAQVDAWIQTIEGNYPNVLFLRLNINENQELVLRMYDVYGVPTEKRGAVPIIFVGDTYYFGGAEPEQFLETKLNSTEEKQKLLTIGGEETEINLAYVVGLGLVDAVNPCELAVLLILMTAILSRYPGHKRKALKAGLLFSAAIFIVYFIFGLLLREVFGFITDFLSVAQTGVFLIFGIIAIIIGILNLKDGIARGAGGFVIEVPQRWRPRMKSLIQGTTSPKGAFFVGLIVAFFLTPCTAGPYLVFSGILSSVSLVSAIPYLILYMLIFIAPMLAITFVTYLGFAKVEDMGEWRENNSNKLHLIAGILMIIIGILMFFWGYGIL